MGPSSSFSSSFLVSTGLANKFPVFEKRLGWLSAGLPNKEEPAGAGAKRDPAGGRAVFPNKLPAGWMKPPKRDPVDGLTVAAAFPNKPLPASFSGALKRLDLFPKRFPVLSFAEGCVKLKDALSASLEGPPNRDFGFSVSSAFLISLEMG
jgi:hypothetical protein